jgi:hypothetical protein
MNHDYQALIPSGDDEDVIRGGSSSNNDDDDNDDNRNDSNGNGINGNGGIINRTTMSCTNSNGSNSDASLLLWDQLNDEQSREVQNHQSRFHAPDPQSRENNPISIALSIANQTVENATDTLSKTAQRAQIAYQEWQQQQHQQQQRRDRTDSNISDEFDLQFGITHDLLRNDREEFVGGGGGGGGEDVGGGQGGNDHHQQHINQHSQDDDNNKADDGGSNSNSSRPLQGYPFVLLKEGRDIPSATNPQIIGGSERDRWGMVGNIDIFLSHLYKYYYNRGYVTFVFCLRRFYV